AGILKGFGAVRLRPSPCEVRHAQNGPRNREVPGRLAGLTSYSVKVASYVVYDGHVSGDCVEYLCGTPRQNARFTGLLGNGGEEGIRTHGPERAGNARHSWSS